MTEQKYKDSTPKIYVASLASYNAGTHHGFWIDCTLGIDHVHEMIKMILATCPEKGEEYAIHDTENFGDLHIKEYQDLEDVVALAEAIEKHGNPFIEFFKWNDPAPDEAESKFEDLYVGTYTSDKDFAEEWTEECYSIELSKLPTFVRSCIDWKQVAEELSYDYEFVRMSYNETYIYRNH